jgi:hypothetical protein
VRRFLIQGLLPSMFCVVPLLAAVLIVVATPQTARDFYFNNISAMDVLILGLGTAIFVLQLGLAWRALQWKGTGFDQRPDRWLSNLAQAAEWFPLLGLIGTVGGILVTFGKLGQAGQTVGAKEIISNYAPAVTATGSGLFMSLINILPTWVALLGRDLILSLGGGPAAASEEVRP